jgi:hypothetical protein
MMNIAAINKQLSTVNPGYTAHFVPAPDETMDNEIEILLHGVKTCWGIQIGADYVGINEYGFEDGELAWSQDHGLYRSTKAAVTKLCTLLPTR